VFLSQSKASSSWHNFYGYIPKNVNKKMSANLQSFQIQFEVIVLLLLCCWLAPLNNSVLTSQHIFYARRRHQLQYDLGYHGEAGGEGHDQGYRPVQLQQQTCSP
jgi:hypothetical protein